MNRSQVLKHLFESNGQPFRSSSDNSTNITCHLILETQCYLDHLLIVLMETWKTMSSCDMKDRYSYDVTISNTTIPMKWCGEICQKDWNIHQTPFVLSMMLLSFLASSLFFGSLVITWACSIDKILTVLKFMSLPSESSQCSANTSFRSSDYDDFCQDSQNIDANSRTCSMRDMDFYNENNPVITFSPVASPPGQAGVGLLLKNARNRGDSSSLPMVDEQSSEENEEFFKPAEDSDA